MSNIFFTSDTHFFHDRDFIYKARGYQCVEEMNEDLITKWNSVVKPSDIVYHCGDIYMGKTDEKTIHFLRQLNGAIYLAKGNHDTTSKLITLEQEKIIMGIHVGYEIPWNKRTFIATHYPMITTNDKPILWSLHGHTHSKDKFSSVPQAYNVAVDAHNGYPVSFEDVASDIKQKMGWSR